MPVPYLPASPLLFFPFPFFAVHTDERDVPGFGFFLGG